MNITKGKIKKAPKIVIYGQEGIGKSTLASQFPAPIFLDTEEGSGMLDVDRTSIANLDDFWEAVRWLKENRENYRTVVLDTVDRLWMMCADYVSTLRGWENVASAPFGKGYAEASEAFRGLFQALDDLQRIGYIVLVIAHARVEIMTPPDGADYSKYCLKISAPSSQAKSAREYVKEWCDVLLFCRFTFSVDSQTRKATGEAVRIISTTPSPAWEAKNRYDLADSIPMDAAELATLWEDVPEIGEPSEKDKEDAMLIAYLQRTGRLEEGKGLDALNPKMRRHIILHRAESVQTAKEWLEKNQIND